MSLSYELFVPIERKSLSQRLADDHIETAIQVQPAEATYVGERSAASLSVRISILVIAIMAFITD